MPNPARKPNLVVIKVDEWRHDHFGFHGNRQAVTPNLDALFAGGAVLDNAFCASPLCVPSRVSYFTGQYVHTHRGTFNNPERHHIRVGQAALPELLKQAGYAVGLAGKNHTFHDDYFAKWFDYREEFLHWGKSHGEIRDSDRRVGEWMHNDPRPAFSKYHWGGKALMGEGLMPGPMPFPEAECPSARIAEDGCAFVDRYAEQPFFLYYSFPDPHWPNVVPEPYYSLVDPDSLELEDYPMDWSGHPFKHFVQSNACGFDCYTAVERRRILATYFGQCAFIDRSIGRLVDHLRQRGLMDDTLIVFSADHGNFAGRYGMIGKTGGFQDALVRIPAAFSGPGIKPGHRVGAGISNVDFLATICTLLGLPLPESNQGVSFAPLVAGGEGAHRRAIFAEVGEWNPPPPPVAREGYAEYNRQRSAKDGWAWFVEHVCYGRSAMLREDDWKFSHYVGDLEELYDLARDPHELMNLATSPEHTSRRDAMRSKLMDWLLTAPFAGARLS